MPGRVLTKILLSIQQLALPCLHEPSVEPGPFSWSTLSDADLWDWGTPDASALCVKWRWHPWMGLHSLSGPCCFPGRAPPALRLQFAHPGTSVSSEEEWCHFPLVPCSKAGTDMVPCSLQDTFIRDVGAFPCCPRDLFTPPGPNKSLHSHQAASLIISQAWL